MRAETQVSLTNRVTIGAQRLWRGIREWCGDAAYERYLKSHAKRACREAIMSPEQFYLAQLQKRYSRVNRCC